MAAVVKEVARRTGLSSATVSRILNGKGGHSAKAVSAVEKIVQELGYSSTRRSGAPDCVGVLTYCYHDFLVYEYSSALLSSVMETLTAEGMITQIIPLTPGRVSFQYIADIVERYNLRGLIIQEFEQLYEITPHLKKLSVPTVCVGDVRDEVENSVRSDSYGAGRDAAAYLWSLGHRSFGVLTASLNDLCQKKRLDGFCEYIKEAGGNPGCIRTKSLSNPEDPHSAVAAAADLANMRGFPDALFSTNSSLTLKLLIELKKFGLTAPENFSLISVEERDELELLETPVTAVKQPVRRMGETSVKMLLGLMRGSLRAPREILACGLVPRGTTRPKKG